MKISHLLELVFLVDFIHLSAEVDDESPDPVFPVLPRHDVMDELYEKLLNLMKFSL